MEQKERFEELPLGQVRPDPHQPRLHMDEEVLQELMASIGRDGLLQPIVVRPDKNDYIVIDGHRRRQACERLGWESIPAIIRSVEEKEAFRLSLVANLQREDLSPFELSEGYERLQRDFNLQQKDIAALVGKSEGTISEAIRIGSLPEEIRQEYEAMHPEDRPVRSFLLLLVRVPGKHAKISLWRRIRRKEFATIEELRRELSGQRRQGSEQAGESRREAHHLPISMAARAAQVPVEYLRQHPQYFRLLIEASEALAKRVTELRRELPEPSEEAVAEAPPPEPTERPRRGGRRRGAAAQEAGSLVRAEAPEDETAADEDSLAAVESADTTEEEAERR